MRILYVTPGVGVCGGVRVMWRHVFELAKRGHEAVYGTLDGSRDMHWLDGNVPVVDAHAVRQQPWDVVVATGWNTWKLAHDSFYRAQRRWGFVQMRESMFLGPPYPNQADRAFSLQGFRVITISAWLKRYLEEECGQKDVVVIPNGVNTGLFYPDPMPIKKRRPIALIVGHGLNEAKNVSGAAKAIRKAGKFEIWHVCPVPMAVQIIGADKIIINPPQDELRQIYSTADILVMSSRAEGRSCIPVEAMACKCPVVAMDHRGTEDLQDGRALIADSGDVEHLAKLIRFTMDNPKETKSRVEASYNYVISELRWDMIGKRLEELYSS